MKVFIIYDMVTYETNQEGAIFNADLEQLRILFEIKKEAVPYFRSWNLEPLFQVIEDMAREIHSILNKAEREQSKEYFNQLNTIREQYLNDEEAFKVAYRSALDVVYRWLCEKLQENNIMFRKKGNPGKAVLE